MTTFVYEARDTTGQRIEGQLEAETPSAAAVALIGQGRTPIRIKVDPRAQPGRAAPARPAPARALSAMVDAVPAAANDSARPFDFLPPGLRPQPRRRVSDMELQMVTRELQAMLRAGVPIMRALSLLRESASNRFLAESIRKLEIDLDSGLELATALEREAQRSRLFDGYYVSIVRVAEATGQLEQGLARLCAHLQFQRTTREQVLAALRYPSFVVVAAVVAVTIINLFVIPQFARVFTSMRAELPALTQMLLAISRGFVSGWPALLAGALGTFAAYRIWVSKERGALQRDALLLRLPIAGDIVRRIALSRFATSLANALRSGVPVAQALSIVAETVGSRPYQRAVEAMRTSVERGESLRVAVAASGLFPALLQQVVTIGEETGSLDELLAEMGQHYQTEVEHEISRLAARIEPVLIVVLGAIVLVLALGVFLPMWEMGRAATGGGR